MNLNKQMELATAIFGSEPATGVERVSATATADSANGSVTVQFEDGSTIDVPVTGAVKSGDEVIVNVQQGTPIAAGAAGWGDRVQTIAADAAIAADDAARTATDFLTFDPTNGLTVGASSLNRSVNINAGGMDVLDGAEVVSHFGSYIGMGGGSGTDGIFMTVDTPSEATGYGASNWFIVTASIQRWDSTSWLICFDNSASIYDDLFELVRDAGVHRVFCSGLFDEDHDMYLPPMVFEVVPTRSHSFTRAAGIWYRPSDGTALWYDSINDRTSQFTYCTITSYEAAPAVLTVNGDLAAQSISSPIATASALGVVKVDGSTITAASDGTISANPIGATMLSWGTCSTAQGTAAKVVACEDFTLEKGAVIGIAFSTANTASAPTLNVNSTGAVSIRIGSSAPAATTNALKWSANTVLWFQYDGTYWRYITSRAAASIVPPDGAGSWYGTIGTAAATAAKVGTVANFRLMTGASVVLRCTAANTVEGALTLNVNATGAKTVYVNNAAASATNPLVWESGEVLTFAYDGSYWRLTARDQAGGSYELPAATATTLGGVKVGDGLAVESDGTLSVSVSVDSARFVRFIPTSAAAQSMGTSVQAVNAVSVVDSGDSSLVTVPATGVYEFAEAGTYRISAQCGMYPNTTAVTRLCVGLYDTSVSGTRLALGVHEVTNLTANSASMVTTISCEYTGEFAAGDRVAFGAFADVTAAKVVKGSAGDLTRITFEKLDAVAGSSGGGSAGWTSIPLLVDELESYGCTNVAAYTNGGMCYISFLWDGGADNLILDNMPTPVTGAAVYVASAVPPYSDVYGYAYYDPSISVLTLEGEVRGVSLMYPIGG